MVSSPRKTCRGRDLPLAAVTRQAWAGAYATTNGLFQRAGGRAPLSSVSRRTLLLLVVALAAPAAAVARSAETIDSRLEKAASQARNRATEEQGINACQEILAEPKATAAQRIRAFDTIVQAYRRRKAFEDAVKLAQTVRETYPADKELEWQAFSVQLDLYREWNKKDQALAAAKEFVERHGGDKPVCAAAQVKMANLLLDMGRNKECLAEAGKALEMDANEARVASALRLMSEAAWRDNDAEQCLKVSARLLEPKYFGAVDIWVQRDAINRYADCLKKLKRFDEVRAHYAKYEKSDSDPRQAQYWCMLVAGTYADENRWDEAIKAYERVFTHHPDVPEHWYSAQWNTASAYANKGSFEDAIRAVRICLDSAGDAGTIGTCVRQIVEWFRKIDDNPTRANAFVNFQRFGPAGEDKEPGTDDDLSNPLDALGYPAYAERERAFAEARRRAGDDAAGSRFRALTWVYSARPKEALKCFADAFARSDVVHRGDRDQVKAARDMVGIGVRAVRGHAVGLDAFYRFVRYGPAGPDGKLNTEDDLEDPFAPLLGITAPSTQPRDLPDGEGGLAELSAEEIRVLREARAVLERFAADVGEQDRVRRDALEALQRVHEALNDWGMAGQQDWYLNLLVSVRQNGLHSTLIAGGQTSAKARRYHLGSVHEYWRRLDSLLAARAAPPSREIENTRKAFDKTVDDLGTAHSLVPNIKPIPLPVSKPAVTPKPKPSPATKPAPATRPSSSR